MKAYEIPSSKKVGAKLAAIMTKVFSFIIIAASFTRDLSDRSAK
jgi:hypothetical protein